MRITEGQFGGAMLLLFVLLVAWGIRGAYSYEHDVFEEKLAFAKDCEARGLSLATVNGAWVCLKYTQPTP
jgi:hypothetical protein